MRIAFAGTPAPAADILGQMVDGHHDVALVLTQPAKPRGRRGTPTPTPVAEAAAARGVECLPVASINAGDVLERLRDARVGALCVVAFGQILRDPVLEGWPCINVHFSILPAYRGAAPVERALMDGVDETGVTIMQMDAGLDTGPIERIVTTPVSAGDDAGTVMARLCALAGPALEDTFDRIEDGTFAVTPQPAHGVSHAAKILAEDRLLDISQPATAVVDRIRALSPHIGVQCRIGGEPFKLWRARVVDDAAPPGLSAVDGRLLVGCAEGTAEIHDLQPPGKGRMAAADFLRGWRGGLELGG